MNKYLRRIISVALAIVLIFAIATQFIAATIFNNNGFLYSVTSNTTADLHGRTTDDADLVIPKEFNEHYITNIVDSAFKDDENIQTLSFSKAILLERIGYYAFENCVNLSGNIYIGGRINEVGTSAFQGCSSLESVMYRNNLVTVISDQCFYNCSSLSYVELPEKLKKIEKYAFANTALTEITIPVSVTSIDTTAFDGCGDLVIKCYTDSAAHQFAVDNGYSFVLLDAPAPTEPPTEAPTTIPTELPTEMPTAVPTQAATEAPTAEPTQQPTELNGYYLGDVNGDNTVTIDDATFIRRYLVSVSYPEECDFSHGDVDGDDNITILDATFIMRYLAEMYVPYPINEFVQA